MDTIDDTKSNNSNTLQIRQLDLRQLHKPQAAPVRKK